MKLHVRMGDTKTCDEIGNIMRNIAMKIENDEKQMCYDCPYKGDCDESPYLCGYVMFDEWTEETGEY